MFIIMHTSDSQSRVLLGKTGTVVPEDEYMRDEDDYDGVDRSSGSNSDSSRGGRKGGRGAKQKL